MNELKIYKRMRQNDDEFITVHEIREFETQQEWEQYQLNIQHENDDIEIIEEPNDKQDCAIL